MLKKKKKKKKKPHFFKMHWSSLEDASLLIILKEGTQRIRHFYFLDALSRGVTEQLMGKGSGLEKNPSQ